MQMSLRLSDELAAHVRKQAAAAGQSVNGWITSVLAAAVDPELAGSEAERIRERLARAGLLVDSSTTSARPAPREVKRARATAGRGTPLERLVSDGRR
jgi:HicB family